MNQCRAPCVSLSGSSEHSNVFSSLTVFSVSHCTLPTLTWKSLGKPNKPFPLLLPLLIKVLCILQTVVLVLWGSSLGAGLWGRRATAAIRGSICHPSCRAWTFFRRSLRSSYVSLAPRGPATCQRFTPTSSAYSILCTFHSVTDSSSSSFFLSRSSPLPARIGINKLQLWLKSWYHLSTAPKLRIFFLLINGCKRWKEYFIVCENDTILKCQCP